MRLYVLQMYYATLKKGRRHVTKAIKTVAALSRGDYVLIRCEENISAIAFACNQTEMYLATSFRAHGDRDFSLMAFDAAWIVGGRTSKRLDDWLDLQESSLRARTVVASERRVATMAP